MEGIEDHFQANQYTLYHSVSYPDPDLNSLFWQHSYQLLICPKNCRGGGGTCPLCPPLNTPLGATLLHRVVRSSDYQHQNQTVDQKPGILGEKSTSVTPLEISLLGPT